VIALGALALLSAPGCAPRGPSLPAIEPGAAGVATLLEALRAEGCPPDLVTDLQLLVQAQGERPVRLQGALRVGWPDRVRLQARVGALFPVASLVARADSCFLHLPRAKAYWSGPTASASANAPGTIAGGILWLLCPGPRLAMLEEPVLDRVSDAWRLRGRMGSSPPLWVTALFEKDRLIVREVLVQGEDGGVWLRAVRRGSQEIERALVPRIVRLEIAEPPSLLEAQILHPRAEPTPGDERFRLPRPPGSRWIDPAALIPHLRAAPGAP
jgi:hypothetical protein